MAQLTIPGAFHRTRVFDVDVQLRARVPDSGVGSGVGSGAGSHRAAELTLSLEIDGSRQWARTVPGRTPGEVDSVDYHCRLVIEPGCDTRLRARAGTRHCSLVELSLSAVEERLG